MPVSSKKCSSAFNAFHWEVFDGHGPSNFASKKGLRGPMECSSCSSCHLYVVYVGHPSTPWSFNTWLCLKWGIIFYHPYTHDNHEEAKMPCVCYITLKKKKKKTFFNSTDPLNVQTCYFFYLSNQTCKFICVPTSGLSGTMAVQLLLPHEHCMFAY